ncbi:cell wall-binding protein [Desulfosporosinus orientis DSM 765]|uniref:Cell wall-binding protein n=1 Tax=Desulfosporosinus orientis (strain ATCC 19365 / DSM 765 / NCIMB 8382 / VKM B-1628 / Singapore I) TaxID=768706 RepID=G7WA49_DESOD|nr:cell wall-binding repeat-containing protein [Desulfosporosinus orientis]AET66187.1 cell wall-binding protein [Desulfosporosinus orientis DSM 765]
MKRELRKLQTWFLTLVMLVVVLIPLPFTKAVYGDASEGSYAEALTRVVDYYGSNSYTAAGTWWDRVGLWGAGDTHKTSWDESTTSLYGNILGMLAKGADPRDALGGLNLVEELEVGQDSNSGAFPGAYGDSSSDQTWAMVALDAAKGEYDEGKAVTNLLSYQNADGGFGYSVDYNDSDPDQSGMALLALANHRTVAGVEEAIENVKNYLKGIQEDSGGFASWGTVNANSIATVISGLVAVGEDPLGADWQKNGHTMLEDLLTFQLENGSFKSPYSSGGSDAMATYQALIALGDLKAHESVWQRLETNAPLENKDSVINPVTVVFDKNPDHQADVEIAMSLNGNNLTSITTDGAIALTNGSDYSVSLDSSGVTIAKEYLAEQETGRLTLNFVFSSGSPQSLQITIEDTSEEGGGSIQPDEGQITFKVVGRNKKTIFPSTKVTLEEGDTPYSVLVRMIGRNQVAVSGSGSSIYVTGIKGTEAGDDGPTSGWMFSINGEYPRVGSGSITLSDGDIVAWRYTTNLGEDIGDSNSGTEQVTKPILDPELPTETKPANGSYRQRNQNLLDQLMNATAAQLAQASFGENISAISPTSGEASVLRAEDGVQLTVPAGALGSQSGPLRFSIEMGGVTTPPAADTGALILNPLKYQRQFRVADAEGNAQEGSIEFDVPVLISFPVEAEDLPEGITTQQLAVYWWNQDREDWIKLGGVYDSGTNTLTVPTYHFSTYAVMADVSGMPKRLAGSDCFQTANAVAEQGWKAGADNVVVVNAYAFSDALAAVPLAFKLNAPILLTERNTLTTVTREELEKLVPKKITLIGGTAVISSEIQADLEDTWGAGNVLRIGGADSFSTAALIASKLGTTGKAILANNGPDCYADTLAISGYAAYQGIPILFTRETALPDVTAQALAAQKVSSTIVVGGSYVIPPAIMDKLPGAERYAGKDRYATATAIARDLNFNRSRVYVVTGLNFADALTAGNLAGHSLSPLIMVDTTVPDTTSAFLKDYRETIGELVVVGGEGIIRADQENDIRAMLPNLDPSQSTVSRQQAAEIIDDVTAWEKAYIEAAFAEKRPGEIVDPTVYNWPTVALGQLERYEGLSQYLEENEKYIDQNWNLLTRKVTDLARISLAVAAAQGDPRNFAGKDLIAELANYPNIEVQGTNGPIYSLIALNSSAYELPADAQWTREKLLQLIVSKQLTDGGFSLDGTGQSDPDLTAMALQALEPYYTEEYPEVQAVVDKALTCLAGLQNSEGKFTSAGAVGSESISQTIIALSALGIDSDTDPRFVKNNRTLLSSLLEFRSGDGGFKHLLSGESDKTASEQALLALTAYERYKDGKGSLYNFKP